jgi:hypothetical protein
MSNITDEEIFDALHEADIKLSRGRPYHEIVAAFEAVGNKYLPLLAGDWRALELRRRVAERILCAAMVAERPIDECESVLNRVIVLGFDDLGDKSQRIAAFAGHCESHGYPDLARRYLVPLIDELESADGDMDLTDIVQDCRELLARIEGRTVAQKQ